MRREQNCTFFSRVHSFAAKQNKNLLAIATLIRKAIRSKLSDWAHNLSLLFMERLRFDMWMLVEVERRKKAIWIYCLLTVSAAMVMSSTQSIISWVDKSSYLKVVICAFVLCDWFWCEKSLGRNFCGVHQSITPIRKSTNRNCLCYSAVKNEDGRKLLHDGLIIVLFAKCNANRQPISSSLLGTSPSNNISFNRINQWMIFTRARWKLAQLACICSSAVLPSIVAVSASRSTTRVVI